MAYMKIHKKGLPMIMDGLEMFSRKKAAFPRWVYEFDGSTMYATLPDWTPNGLPFEVSVGAVPLTVDASNRRILSGPNGQAGFQTTSGDKYKANYQDGGNINRGLNFNEGASVGAVVSLSARYSAAISEGNANSDYVNNAVVAGPLNNTENRIGTNALANGGFFHGPIYNLRLTDSSPIQDTDACFGDSTRYVQLEQPIVLEGDFEIEFDWIRQDRTGTSTNAIIGSSDTSAGNTYFLVRDTGHANANEAAVAFRGIVRNFPGAFAAVAQGQHVRVRLHVTSSFSTLYVDGTEVGTYAGVTSGVSYDRIGTWSSNLNQLPANSALQNIIIRDLTNNREWLYTLDEGSGTDAFNTGKTQGNYLNQPLWDRYTLDGNGTRYVEIPEFAIPNTDDFILSVDWIRQEQTGTDLTSLIGAASIGDGIYARDTGATEADYLVLEEAGVNTVKFPNALTNIAIGQHCSIEFRRVGGTYTCTVDGVDIGPPTIAGTVGELNMDRIGSRQGAREPAAGSALGNVILENLTTGEYIEYRIDEGSGTTVKAYDKAGNEVAGKEGTITPDAAWTLQPEYSNNGQWTPDTDWQNVPNNKRFYPMDDLANPMRDALGDGSTDATIVNYDPGNWKIIPAGKVSGYFKAQSLGAGVTGFDFTGGSPNSQINGDIDGAELALMATVANVPSNEIKFVVSGNPGQMAFTTFAVWQSLQNEPNFLIPANKAVYDNGEWTWDAGPFEFVAGQTYYIYMA